MTQHTGRTRQSSSPSGRAGLGAAVLLASAAVLTGCAAGGSGGASSSPAAATSSSSAASSTSAGASGSASSASAASGSASSASSSSASSSSAAGLPAGMNADVELPENEKVLALKAPMAEILGIQGDVTVDTTATGEFAALQAQQQEYATSTDPEAEEQRSAVLPVADDACWAAQGRVHGLLAESGGTEVSYGGTRAEQAEGAEPTGQDSSVLIITLPDEAAATLVQQAEQDRQTTCAENPDYADRVATERSTVDGVDYDVTTTAAAEDGAGPMPGTTVTTQDGARIISVTLHEAAGAEATPEQALEAAQAVREAVAEEFGAAS